jgi:hypothetical protein
VAVAGHLIGVAFLVAGFAIYVANLDRLPMAKTVAEIRTHLAVVTVGERVLILGGMLLIPSALIMATQYWSLSQGWIATSIALVLAQGQPARQSVFTYGNSTPFSITRSPRGTRFLPRSPHWLATASSRPSTVPP